MQEVLIVDRLVLKKITQFTHTINFNIRYFVFLSQYVDTERWFYDSLVLFKKKSNHHVILRKKMERR